MMCGFEACWLLVKTCRWECTALLTDTTVAAKQFEVLRSCTGWLQSVSCCIVAVTAQLAPPGCQLLSVLRTASSCPGARTVALM
jgi:hypothetical protein